MASPHSSAPSSDTLLPHVSTPQVDTQVILQPVVLPTPPTFAPRLSITTQLTRPAYNFTSNNYSAWASGFELFLESHNLIIISWRIDGELFPNMNTRVPSEPIFLLIHEFEKLSIP